MRANRLKALWAEGKGVVNAWLSIGDAFTAEIMARQGWDAVTIDTQHGLVGYAEMMAMLQAVSATDAVPIVRVAWNVPGEIMKALDAGAYGIICPMINDRAEAEAFVGACRYPPAGYRSFGPARAALYGGVDYAEHANDEMLAFAMIETARGLANVEAIAATPGLSGLYIGPADLSLALGGAPTQDSDDAMRLEAFDKILAACGKAGVRAGVHTNSAAYSQKMLERGFDLVTVGSDMRYLGAGGRRDLTAMREWQQAKR